MDGGDQVSFIIQLAGWMNKKLDPCMARCTLLKYSALLEDLVLLPLLCIAESLFSAWGDSRYSFTMTWMLVMMYWVFYRIWPVTLMERFQSGWILIFRPSHYSSTRLFLPWRDPDMLPAGWEHLGQWTLWLSLGISTEDSHQTFVMLIALAGGFLTFSRQFQTILASDWEQKPHFL